MSFTWKEIRVLEAALNNYKVLWQDAPKSPSEVVYINMNIAEFQLILQKIKGEV